MRYGGTEGLGPYEVVGNELLEVSYSVVNKKAGFGIIIDAFRIAWGSKFSFLMNWESASGTIKTSNYPMVQYDSDEINDANLEVCHNMWDVNAHWFWVDVVA